MLYFKSKYWDVEKFATEAQREQHVRMGYPGITFGKFRGHEGEYAAWHKMRDEVWSEMSARAAEAISNGTCDVWTPRR